MEVDAVYHGHAYDYVDTKNDIVAAALFRGALEEASSRGKVDAMLATGSLHSAACVEHLLEATGQTYRPVCWTTSEVRQYLANARWPSDALLDDDARRDLLTAQFFLQACAAGGYGIQFGS